MEERLKFVLACGRRRASIPELCRQFAISRRTGYEWRGRYQAGGIGELNDRSKAPLDCPHRMDPEVEAAVLEPRHEHPAWGPGKLRAPRKSRRRGQQGKGLRRYGSDSRIRSAPCHP